MQNTCFICHYSKKPPRLAFACLPILLGLITPQAYAQNPATDLARNPNVAISPDVRGNLETIGRYAGEINRRVQGNGVPSAEALPDPVVGGERVSVNRDPFEVSPQLREGRTYRYSGLPSASVLEVQRRIQVRAIIRAGQSTLAQLLINNKDAITVMDMDLIDLEDLGTFQVEIKAGMVSLLDPNNNEGKKVVLR